MTNEERVRASFSEQAAYCERLSSVFMRDLLNGLAEHLDHTSQTGFQILNWQGNPEPKEDALALRVAGALHDLARSGDDPVLSKYYESPQHSDDRDFIPAVLNAISEFDDRLWPWLKFAPQTNEVRRTAALLPGFLTIARATGLPLWLSELGCSAGLNLLWDQFRVTLDGQHHGPGGSTVEITPEWRGTPPPVGKVSVVGRRGVDLNPLDVSRPFVADRLMAYIWPDQADRLQRTQAAIELFNQFSPGIDQGDAVTWLETRLGAQPAGACHVVYHTIAWQYFPAQAQARGAAMLAKAGEMATAQTPLAHLAMEADGAGPGAKISLTIWPGGDARVLGRADFHGRWVEWAG